jgi:hypothetical protein
MIRIAGLLICLIFVLNVRAQNYKIDETGEVIFNQYQIFLTEPAQEIKELENMEGEEIKGRLSPDGNKIILENYTKKEKLRVKVEYESGRIEEFTRSPCYIDPLVM